MSTSYITLDHLEDTVQALTNELDNKPSETDLSPVAFSGDYSDLSNTPNLSVYLTEDDVYEFGSDYFMMQGRDYVTAGQIQSETRGSNATAEGYNVSATGSYSHAEGSLTKALGPNNHAEGYLTLSSSGIVAGNGHGASHAEGVQTIASDSGSHSEGMNTVARGGSHAEGQATFAAVGGHAEGQGSSYNIRLTGGANVTTYTVNNTSIPALFNDYLAQKAIIVIFGYDETAIAATITNVTVNNNVLQTITLNNTLSKTGISNIQFTVYIPNAYGYNSHSEGNGTYAIGDYSHSEGAGTIAYSSAQHAGGLYNIPTAGAEVIGGGTAATRANIRTLDWSGNEVLAGKLTVGANPVNNMDVVTKQYMESQGYLTLATLPVYDGTVI